MNKSGVEPLGNKVLVKTEKVEETYGDAGIVIPKETREKEQIGVMMGEVVAVGPACWEDYEVRDWGAVGDYVLYARHVGVLVTGIDGEDYKLLFDTDLIAKTDKGVKV